MSTCYFLDLFVQLSSNDLGSCKVRRKNRPCLVCKSPMDLVEVTQSINLFFLPICFNTKTMNFLDCPECSFSSTVESYEYLRICQQEGETIEQYSVSGVDGEQSLTCRDCKSKLAEHWVYCPTCGAKFDRPKRMPRRIRFREDLPSLTHMGDDSTAGESTSDANGWAEVIQMDRLCGTDSTAASGTDSTQVQPDVPHLIETEATTK